MPQYTTILGLYKPGGGASGLITPDEPVDIDKLNGNFDLIDAALGVKIVPDASLPSKPYIGQLAKATTTDNLVVWNGTNWIGFLPDRLSATNLSTAYYTQGQLEGGALDNRYYTQSQLLNDGKLDTRYYTKTGIKFDSGSYLATTTVDSAGGYSDNNTTLNFNTKFTQPPIVVMTPDTGAVADQHWGVKNITTTTFDPFYWRSDTTDATMRWIAIGV